MANEDPVLNFIESLPVQGMTLGNKVVIFTTVVTVLLAAVLTTIATWRKGVKSGNGKVSQQMKFATLKNEDDRIMAMKIELDALYIAHENTEEAHNRGKLTSSSYYKLLKLYDTEIKVIESKLSDSGHIYNENEFESPEEVKEVVNEFEDLAKQVTPKNEKVDVRDLDPFAPKVQTPPVIPPIQDSPKPVTQSPPVQAPAQVPQGKVNIPPSPGKANIPTPSGTKVNIPPPPTAGKPSIPTPSSPKTAIPSPQKPDQLSSVSPFEAQNPLEGTEENKDKFAQSTSIAALRSDMLRELARLRKYIHEGEEE